MAFDKISWLGMFGRSTLRLWVFDHFTGGQISPAATTPHHYHQHADIWSETFEETLDVLLRTKPLQIWGFSFRRIRVLIMCKRGISECVYAGTAPKGSKQTSQHPCTTIRYWHSVRLAHIVYVVTRRASGKMVCPADFATYHAFV